MLAFTSRKCYYKANTTKLYKLNVMTSWLKFKFHLLFHCFLLMLEMNGLMTSHFILKYSILPKHFLISFKKKKKMLKLNRVTEEYCCMTSYFLVLMSLLLKYSVFTDSPFSSCKRKNFIPILWLLFSLHFPKLNTTRIISYHMTCIAVWTFSQCKLHPKWILCI